MSTDTPATGDRVVVVIASAGRPALLGDVVDDLRRQTRQAAAVVVSVPDEESLPAPSALEGVVVVHGRGAAAQRNRGLDAVPDATHAFFFDDDAVVREDYLEQAMAFFNAHPDVVGVTGRVLLDGAASEAVPREAAVAAVELSRADRLAGAWRPGRELYGCNFGYRLTAAPGERFDERLPLYSWLEDHDLARRLLRRGSIARVDDCVVVHRGVKSGGRTAHARLGYSQVMNPFYLHSTGSFPLWLTVREAARPLARNVVRSAVHPERSWRRRRLRGNLLAGAHLLGGRRSPEHILQMPAGE